MKNNDIIPIHTFETEQAQTTASPICMYVEWGGKRKVWHTPHRHAFNELIFVTQGGGKHEIDFCDYPLQTHSVHFVKTAQVHLIDRTDDAAGCSILFSDDFLHAVQQNPNVQKLPFFQASFYPIVQLDAPIFEQINPILAQIKTEYAATNLSISAELIRTYCQILCLLTLKGYHALSDLNKRVQPPNNTTQQFIALIEQYFRQHYTIAQYATLLQLSPNYLSDLCKQETGKTAHQLIQDRILLEAKRLLCYSELPIKAIAYELHFEDTAYFSRFFKKNTLVSPIEYRKATLMR